MTEPVQPPPMSKAKVVAYSVILPVSMLALVFGPVGRLGWWPGWIFIAIVVAGFTASAIWIARANPVIYRARSRFQPGTQAWDKKLLALMLPAMVAEIPLATLDAGRLHWSNAPLWIAVLGYAMVLASIAGTGWAQVVNPFFEPGVR